MDTQTHWDKIYTEKAPNAVRWFRPHLETSLELIERLAPHRQASIIVAQRTRRDHSRLETQD